MNKTKPSWSLLQFHNKQTCQLLVTAEKSVMHVKLN